ncbi:MAG: DUF3788 family protein [bacterium]|nr:DUF3788 family protein [bacterium]
MPSDGTERIPSPELIPFIGFPCPPEPEDIRRVLGRSSAAWELIRSRVSEQYGSVSENWALPAKKYGWSLRLKLKKRTILHLGPRTKHFIVAIILGERAVAAVRKSHLDPEVIAEVESATRYTEGRVLRFEIRSKKEAEVVLALARIKMDH